MSVIEIFRFSKTEEKIVGALIFLSPVFFLTIRGWTNGISFILFAVSLFCVGREPSAYFKDRDRIFWSCFVCLILPFASELFVQVFRGQFVPSSLDGPSRFLIASLLFVLISRIDVSRLIRLFNFGALLCLPITLCFLLFRFYYSSNSITSAEKWAGRWSMEFADPNTFASFFTAVALLVLGAGLKDNRKFIKLILFCCFVALCTFVLIKTGSRSGWLGFLFGVFVWGMIVFKGVLKKFAFLILLVVSAFVLYKNNEIVASRTDSAMAELSLSPGNKSTGTRIRQVLLEMDLQMIKMQPFLGWPDGDVPIKFSEIFSSQDDLVVAAAKNIKAMAGSHTELTARLVRMGLIFGSISFFSLFIFPFLLIWFGTRRSNQKCRRANYLGITLFLSSLFVSSFGIQILNLKMFATFYAIVLALLFSSRLSGETSAGDR